MSSVDLFLSFNSSDRELVQELQRLLKARGVLTFLDRDQLPAGLPWPQRLEEALREARAVAVLLGKDGLGEWQRKEMYFSLMRQDEEHRKERNLPVIPVLLPGVSDPGAGFLFLNTWVDLRKGFADEGIEILLSALRGAPSVSPLTGVSPFRRLESFREEDAVFFFGREKAAQGLLDLILRCDLVALVGASGSGKSSLVQAGLLPRLRRQRPPEAVWDALFFSPGHRPFRALATAVVPLWQSELTKTERQSEETGLAKIFENDPREVEETLRRCLREWKGTDRLLVIIDQFEELFTEAGEEREAFLDSLLEAQRRLPLTLLFTLRADFYDRVIGLSQDLGERIQRGQMILYAMKGEDLRKAIEEPAKRVGLPLEPGLVERILADAGTEPGSLPLVEFSLSSLWERRSEGKLTHGAYEEIGKVAGAIQKAGEGFLESLPPKKQPVARRVITRLVRVSPPEEGGRRTRQRIPLTELSPTEREIAQLLATEKGKRLLVAGPEGGTETVTLAHEALIDHWQRLKDWLAEDRELFLWRQRLRGSLAQWERVGREEDALLHGALLSEAERWLNTRPEELSDKERQFVLASVALRERQREEEERRRQAKLEEDKRRQQAEIEQAQALANEQRRRVRWLSVASLVLVLLGLVSIWLWRQAVGQRRSATATYISTQIPDVSNPQSALLLSLQALDLTRRAGEPRFPPVEESLRKALVAFGGRPLRVPPEDLLRTVVSPDGNLVAASGRGGRIRLWNLSVANVAAGERVLSGAPEPATHLAISPDNRWVAAANDTALNLWDLQTKAPGGRSFEASLEGDPLQILDFSPDSQWLATRSTGGPLRLWKVARPDLPAEDLDAGEAGVLSYAFSSDGCCLAAGGADGRVHLWELTKSSRPPIVFRASEKPVVSLAFLSGKRVVTLDGGGFVRQWNGKAPEPGSLLLDRIEPVVFSKDSLKVSPDGRWLVAWSPGHLTPLERLGGHYIALLWNVQSAAGPPVLVNRLPDQISGGPLSLAVFSPDSRWLATVDDVTRLWKLGDEISSMVIDAPPARSLVFSRESSRLAISDDYGVALRQRDSQNSYLHSGFLIGRGHEMPITMMSFGATGRWLFTRGGAGDPPRVWDLHRKNPAGPSEPVLFDRPLVSSLFTNPLVKTHTLAIAQRGDLLLTVGSDRRIASWKLASDDPVPSWMDLPQDRDLGSADFSPAGDWLATSSKNFVEVWKLSQGSTKHFRTRNHDKPVSIVRLGPGARWLAVGLTPERGRAAEVHLWDLGNPSGKSVPLRSHTDRVNALAFSPDGKWLATGGEDDEARLWNLESPSKPRFTFKGHGGAVHAITFSADGRGLVTGGTDRLVRIWRDFRRSGRNPPEEVLRGSAERFESIAVSADEQWVVARPGPYLWNRERDPDVPIRFPEWFGRQVLFSRDSRWLFTEGSAGNILRWRLGIEDLQEFACATAGRSLTKEEWARFLENESFSDRLCQ